MDQLDILADADPETIQAMVDSGLIDQRAALARQKGAIGMELFQTPSAQGQHVGGTYVASSPLEHLAVAMQRGIGARRMSQSSDEQGALLNQRQQAMGKGWTQIIDAMRRRAQAAGQPATAPADISVAAPEEQ